MSGIEATGIDGSAVAIEKAVGFAAEKGVKPTLVCDDFFTHDFKKQFDVVEASGLIQHFHGDELAFALDRLMGFVAPGGTLCIFYETENWHGSMDPKNARGPINKFEVDLPKFLESHGFKVEPQDGEGVVRKQGKEEDNVPEEEAMYSRYIAVIARKLKNTKRG